MMAKVELKGRPQAPRERAEAIIADLFRSAIIPPGGRHRPSAREHTMATQPEAHPLLRGRDTRDEPTRRSGDGCGRHRTRTTVRLTPLPRQL